MCLRACCVFVRACNACLHVHLHEHMCTRLRRQDVLSPKLFRYPLPCRVLLLLTHRHSIS